MPLLNPDYQVGLIEDADRALERDLARIDATMRGRQPFTPEAEAEERARAQAAYADVAETRLEILRDAVLTEEAGRETILAELANPRLGWPAEQVQETNVHQVAIDRDLTIYTPSDLAAQMRAALANGTGPLLLAWRDGLIGVQARMQRDPSTPAVAQRDVAGWVEQFSAKLRERNTAAAHRLQDVDGRLKRYSEGLQRARDLVHPRRVEANRERAYNGLRGVTRQMVEL